jgi:hypothetical protein
MYRWERVADIDGRINECIIHRSLYGLLVKGDQDRVDISAPIKKRISRFSH